MIEDDRRYRIIEEIEKVIGVEEAPADALTLEELCQKLNIGRRRLKIIIKEMGNQVNVAKIQRINTRGNHYWATVYWFEDEENTLHK